MPEECKDDYPEESVGSIMSTNVLAAGPNDNLAGVLKAIAERQWDDVRYVYVVDDRRKLLGVLDLSGSPKTDTSSRLEELKSKPCVTVHPCADQEVAVVQAIKHDITAVPVVDDAHIFSGPCPPGR